MRHQNRPKRKVTRATKKKKEEERRRRKERSATQEGKQRKPKEKAKGHFFLIQPQTKTKTADRQLAMDFGPQSTYASSAEAQHRNNADHDPASLKNLLNLSHISEQTQQHLTRVYGALTATAATAAIGAYAHDQFIASSVSQSKRTWHSILCVFFCVCVLSIIHSHPACLRWPPLTPSLPPFPFPLPSFPALFLLTWLSSEAAGCCFLEASFASSNSRALTTTP